LPLLASQQRRLINKRNSDGKARCTEGHPKAE
jgi:hypothetical protein